MSPVTWSILLFVSGIVVLLAELLLPTHGLLGVIGAGMVIGSVCMTFFVNQWAGVVSLLILAAAAPFVCMWIVKIWPKTFVGRRLVLTSPPDKPQTLVVQIGQLGATLSELRPMGMCEFSGQRVEASSEFGTIPPGTQVKVVSLVDRRPIVRRIG
jgi:membrane-bound serine protease (ClpP class)